MFQTKIISVFYYTRGDSIDKMYKYHIRGDSIDQMYK